MLCEFLCADRIADMIHKSHTMTLKKAYIRFYEELNDFLSENRKKKDLEVLFFNAPSVKDIIESFGIPHTEVDLVLINSEPVCFKQTINDQDRISVYPKFESFDISQISKLQNRPLRAIQFILDVHLGKLTRYLRLCGFDSLYNNQYKDHDIVSIASTEHRIILTRDIGILKHAHVQHGYWLRSDNPEEQLREVIRRFDLKDQINLFARCMECNGIIQNVSKSKVADQLQPGTKQYYHAFYQCNQCKKIYWKGSHYQNMIQFINDAIYNKNHTNRNIDKKDSN